MTITKTRGAMKKLGPISLGSKVVRFQVHNVDRRFTVHEDLICRTSAYFKNQLQKNRKPLHQDPSMEECCVCQDELDPIIADITYCITCGQNVHNSCIEKWKRTSNQPSGDRQPATCPMCRAHWKLEPLLLKNLIIDAVLDAEAIQIYLDWLYSSNVRISDNIDRASDDFNVKLLKCWAVAEAVEDVSFRDAIVTTFFVESGSNLGKESIKWAFTDGYGGEEIEDFIIQVFMSSMKPGWFRKESAAWPDLFVRKLADRAFAEMDEKRSYVKIREEWMEYVEKKEEEEAQVETTAGKKKRLAVDKKSTLSDDDFSWLEYEEVKSKKTAQPSKSRRHVGGAQSSGYQIPVERRTEQGQAKVKQAGQFLSDQALRVMRVRRLV
ncbi:hypothetical protein CC86DRAFT_393528 [Ophiobolus disseminans]|uniref:RING-type domain-containing protein n=1 Tax=Ophiobolus disseminans TaxID=1469910 RepID=A0A6A7A288_9PLEO|nr:hypothetical protein CC86DRAFT_393528 [Ophiobolus disseminans]